MQAGTLLLHVALCLTLGLLAQAHLRLSRQTNKSPVSGANVTHSTEYDEPSNVLKFRFNVDLGYAAAGRPPTIRRSELQTTDSGFILELEVPVQQIEAVSSFSRVPQSNYNCLNGWYLGSSKLSKRSVVQCSNGNGLSHSGISRTPSPENSWNNVDPESRRDPQYHSSDRTPKGHIPDRIGGWVLGTPRPQLQKQGLNSNRRNIEATSALVNSWNNVNSDSRRDPQYQSSDRTPKGHVPDRTGGWVLGNARLQLQNQGLDYNRRNIESTSTLVYSWNIIPKYKSSSSLRSLNPLPSRRNEGIKGRLQTQATRPPTVQRPSENGWLGYRR